VNESPEFRLELAGVNKTFGGVRALKGVDFAVRAGEIHGLIGPNGAGKSTLIKIIAGVHQPDAGTLQWEGKPVHFAGPADAAAVGVATIYQELALAPNLSVAENLFLGREPRRWGWVDRRGMFRAAEAALKRLHLEEIGDVNAVVGGLSTARRQLVEIARALEAKSKLLILDEPTSSLSREEVELLFGMLRKLAAAGTSMIFISHRFEELRRLCGPVTLLKDGATHGTKVARELTASEFATWMIGTGAGRAGATDAAAKRETAATQQPVLVVRDLRTHKLKGASLAVRPGEIVGLAGRLGSGRSSLLRAIYGIDRPSGGSVEVAGRSVRRGDPNAARRRGIAFTPEDRKREGLVVSQTVGFNLTIPWTEEWIWGPLHFRGRRREIVERGMKAFAVRAAGPEAAVETLSGGNQQKIVLAKSMEKPPKVFLLDEPTRGIDVAARAEIHARLRELAAAGMAIVLASSEFDELLALADRLILIHDGAVMGELSGGEVDEPGLAARLSEFHE